MQYFAGAKQMYGFGEHVAHFKITIDASWIHPLPNLREYE